MVKIRWTEKAQAEELKILEYAVKNYTKASYKELYGKFKRAEINLVGNPYIGAREYYLAERKNDYRSLFVPKYFKLVYYYDEKCNTVFVVDVWDTRKEPVIQASRLE